MANLWAALRPLVKPCIGGSLIGLAVSDRYFPLAAVDGSSMHPTFENRTGEYALVERSSLARYDFSRGDVVTFVGWSGFPVTGSASWRRRRYWKVPEGHRCWVEGDNGSVSWDSIYYGPLFADQNKFGFQKKASTYRAQP